MNYQIPKKTDIVVIGGGPTGSSAATFLRQKGYDVVILEKKRHPRYQVGESIIPHIWKYTQALGARKKLEDEGFLAKAGGTVVWNGIIHQMAFKAFGYDGPALHVERDRFDHILLDHSKEAGAQVFEEINVTKVDLGDAPKVHYKVMGDNSADQIECKFVLDASGQSGVLAKQLSTRVLDPDFRFMSIWGYFQNSKYFSIEGKARPFSDLSHTPPTTFVSNVDGWGWLWHIPLRTTTSVGLVLPVDIVKDAKSQEDLETYFERRCREIPYLDRLLEGATYERGKFHAIRDYSYKPVRATGPGYFLLGDSAGFIDPIFSVGVPLGMYSAYLGVWAVDRALTKPSTAEQSQKLYEKQLMARLEMSRALALPCYQPPTAAKEEVKNTIQLESSIEQELIHVVTRMTTRGANFDVINEEIGGKQWTSNKYWRLDDLTF